MNKTLKWIGMVIMAVVLLLLAGAVMVYAASSSKLDKGPSVTVNVVPTAEGAEAAARGRHLVEAITNCTSCHGQDLAGQAAVEDPAIGILYAPNLTAGEGGVGATLSDEDWARAIRHGIGPDGRVLAAMPSNAYAHLGDDDLADLLAYIKSLPPVDRVLPARQISLPGTIIFGTMAYGTLPANTIDHAAVGGQAPQAGANAAYGEYLTLIAGCHDCHGPDLGGVDPENAPPGPPPGPNLHASGDLGSWSQEDFIATLRTGRTPNGRQLSTEMPWEGYRLMTDEELGAIWLYLNGLE
ncbi:MAG: c-type cytochrome [Candidatus Promineifilaceae bacterium]